MEKTEYVLSFVSWLGSVLGCGLGRFVYFALAVDEVFSDHPADFVFFLHCQFFGRIEFKNIVDTSL